MSRAGSPSDAKTCPYLIRAGRGAPVSRRTTRASPGPVSVISIGTPSSTVANEPALRESRARRRRASRSPGSDRARPSRASFALAHHATGGRACGTPCSGPARRCAARAGRSGPNRDCGPHCRTARLRTAEGAATKAGRGSPMLSNSNLISHNPQPGPVGFGLPGIVGIGARGRCS